MLPGPQSTLYSTSAAGGIVSVVDNRRYNRLVFRVLDHDSTQDDVRAFLTEFQGQLDRRGLSVLGITTDGSALYPEVLKKLWPKARHHKRRLLQPAFARNWCGGDAFATALFNALSMSFPFGEQFALVSSFFGHFWCWFVVERRREGG